MKTSVGTLPLLLTLFVTSADAFAPTTKKNFRQATLRPFSPIDPSNLHELPHQIHSFQDVMSSFSIADIDAAAIPAGEVTQAAKSDNGWFGFLTGPTMGFLQLIHAGLNAVGLKSNSWGISIIVLTLTIKLLTYPLTKTQLESTQKMQVCSFCIGGFPNSLKHVGVFFSSHLLNLRTNLSQTLQPTMKEIQAKYQSNPEVMNQKIAELYQTNDVNPLAGCLPTLVQLPVFVGLYRAVLDLANENALDESFLWLPSLEGPTYGADPSKGSAWLFDNWANGAPSLGWEETTAFLILPVFLVLSQFLSMEIMTPKEQKEQQPSFLKFLPLMIGYFSLNVPSALCVYWVTNNIVTTATSVIIRNGLKMEPATVGATIETTASVAEPSVFSPPTIREKPAGFANSAPPTTSGVTPITSTEATIDAEILTEVSDEPLQAAQSTASKKKVCLEDIDTYLNVVNYCLDTNYASS